MHETTNPTLIMLINMTIVFAVLFFLSLIIRFIKVIDDMLFKKSPKQEAEVTVAPTAPAPEPAVQGMDLKDKELIAVLTTAIMAYGYKDVRIHSIVKK